MSIREKAPFLSILFFLFVYFFLFIISSFTLVSLILTKEIMPFEYETKIKNNQSIVVMQDGKIVTLTVEDLKKLQ